MSHAQYPLSMLQKYFAALVSIFIAMNSAIANPLRVASVNLCTDQYVLEFVPHAQIASLSHLATDADYSALWQRAKNIPLNHGMAEELLPLKPDLVLATSYTPGSAVQLLKQQGVRVEEIDLPKTIDEMIVFTEKIGALLGKPEQGKQLSAELRARLDKVKTKQNKTLGTALVYAPNGYTGGKNTLKDEILTTAGWKNLASELGMDGYGNLPLEALLSQPPDLLILDDSTRNTNSLAQQLLNHPALRNLPNHQTISLPTHLWLCATPKLIDAIEQLAALPNVVPEKTGNTP
jgi:iron complex transport system substrate-binding protein